MRKQLLLGTVLALCVASLMRAPDGRVANAGEPSAVTAIDILLEPDATLLQRAQAANEGMLKNFPKGFALGKSHQPHISCLQRFVKTADLAKVYEAVGKVLAEEKPERWKLKAFKYVYVRWNDNYLAVIAIEPSDELIRYQKKLIDAVAPFTGATGTAAAFVTTKEAPDINQPTIDWVKDFVPNQVGKNFEPHVTVGLATEDYLKKLVAEKFDAFTFGPTGASIYKLGNFGTARTLLKSFGSVSPQGQPAAVPLASWKDGPNKKAIVDFVKATTDKSSPKFVPAAERIATFDNDGTLWVEQPMYTQLAFALDRVKALAPKHETWLTKGPFDAVLKSDREAMAKFTKKDLEEIIAATHAGMTSEEFHAIVMDWLAQAKHQRFKRPYTECIYQPMLEVMLYLRANGFKTYIVTGGGQPFVRAFSDKSYSIPAEQVIGSSLKLKYTIKDGRPIMLRLPALLLIDDEEGKPEDIELFIGQKPLAAFGNSNGDRQMLEWTQSGGGARLMMLVHHDDAEREYAYGADSKFGNFSNSLMTEATQKGWNVISMKNDWLRVFPW